MVKLGRLTWLSSFGAHWDQEEPKLLSAGPQLDGDGRLRGDDLRDPCLKDRVWAQGRRAGHGTENPGMRGQKGP